MKVRSIPALRTLCLAAAALAFAFPLVGCGASKSASDASSAPAAAGADGAPGGGASGGAPGTGGRRRMAQILMTLGLSDDQKTQIRAIMRATRKESAGADPTTRRANYKAAFVKIDALLTPEQRTTLHAKLGDARKGHADNAPAQS